MVSHFLGKLAIGAGAFGAAAATMLILAATSGPSIEARLGVLGVELSLSIGDAPAAGSPAYLEASMLRRSPDNRMSGVDLRVAKSSGQRAPASGSTESAVSQVAATPVLAPCAPSDT